MRLDGNTIVLSERNLWALLAKLNGHPPDSAATIVGGSDAPGVVVRAEINAVHYADREPGPIHGETEEEMVRLICEDIDARPKGDNNDQTG